MRIVKSIVGCAIAAGAFGSAGAADCGGMAKHLGLCQAAEQFAVEAVDRAMKQFDKSVLDARELANQFGALVGDLHGTDPVRKARARSIFEGVLGPGADIGKDFSLQYSVRLVGNAKLSMQLDSYVFSRDTNEAVSDLFRNDIPAFHGRPLNGTPVFVLTNDVIMKRVQDAAKKAAFEMHANDGCVGTSGAHPCRRAALEQALTDLARSIQGTPEPLPVSNRHSAAAPGGMVVLLARKAELDTLRALPNPPHLQLWVHQADKPNSPTTPFMDPDTRAVTPQNIALNEFGKSGKCIPSDKPHGEICYLWARLRLQAISEYVENKTTPSATGGKR